MPRSTQTPIRIAACALVAAPLVATLWACPGKKAGPPPGPVDAPGAAGPADAADAAVEGTSPGGDAPTTGGADGARGDGRVAVAMSVDRVEAGLADGSRFVDLATSSGAWVVRDREGIRSLSHAVLNELHGVKVTQEPLVLRLSAADVAGRCVTLLITGNEGAEVTVGPTGAKGRTTALAEEPTLLTHRCYHATHDEGEDLRISGKGAVVLAGLWLATEQAALPATPPALAACADDASGVAVPAGASAARDVILGPGQSLEVKLTPDGVRADDVTVTVHADGATPATLDVGGESREATYRNDGPAGAVRVVTRLDAAAKEPVCVSLSTPLPSPVALDQNPLPADAVVVIMTDTMRADLYPQEGSAFGVPMASIADLASRSTVFASATAHASYTKPSVGSILTGLYPDQHGGLPRKSPISDAVPLVSEMLGRAGVTSVAFMSNFFFNPSFGLRRGWSVEHFVDPYKAAMDDGIVLERFESWCSEPLPAGPLLVYVHLMGAHAPYAPPDDYRKEFLAGQSLASRLTPRHTADLIADLTAGRAKKLNRRETDQMVALYRADAAYHDRVMERLLAALEKSGLMDRATVIYTSDHGEEFYEHGRIGHGTGLWYEQVSVPLMVHAPGQTRGRVVQTLAGHVDVTPTILSTLGVEVPENLPGRSLVSLAVEADRDDRALLMSDWMGRWGVRLGAFKLLRRPADELVFSLAPGGEQELDPYTHPILHTLLRRHLAWELMAAGAGGDAPAADAKMDPELEKQLEALGYIMN